MGKLEYLTLNFKNLEKVVVEPKHLIAFSMMGVTTSIRSFGDTIIEKREEAGYIKLSIEEFVSEKSDELSELYSNTTPYQRILQDTTIESITLHYKDDTSEEVYVPYKNNTPETIGENEVLVITEKVFEIPYYEPRKGIELEFNPEEYPY